MTVPSLDQLQADAQAISATGSPKVRQFALDTVAYLRSLVPASGARTARWYPGSAFDTPIPAGVAVHPQSAAMIAAHFVPQGANDYNKCWLGPRGGPNLGAAPAVAYPDDATPLVTVQLNFPTMNTTTLKVPIPSGTDVGDTSHSENKLVVMLADGTEWDFFDITPPGVTTFDYTNEGGPPGTHPGNANWQCLVARAWLPGWTGKAVTPGYGWSDSSIFQGAGIIRAHDLQATPVGGNWGHALCLDFAGNSASHVLPAISSDGRNADAGAAPMGARFQLDPAVAVETLTIPEWQKQMLRTMQVYGLISCHSATGQGAGDGLWTEWYRNLGAYKYPWADQSTGAWPGYYSPALNVPTELLSRFRVIDWTKWTG